jgi:flagellar hook-basal body complex protein FliE
MSDLRIENTFSSPLEKMARERQTKANPLGDFKKVLTDSIGEVNSQLLQADADTREMIAGTKDIHQAMISMEEAHISMRLLIQVRNKVISAYEEIMRMQF